MAAIFGRCDSLMSLNPGTHDYRTAARVLVLLTGSLALFAQTPVSDRARVCSGCGAEVVRGATRRERFLVGVVFAVAAFLILTVVLRMFQIGRGSLLLPSPKADGALFIFLGLIGLLVFSYMIGKRVAHFLRRSHVRFYRAYRHPEQVGGIVYMEALVRPVTWEEWPANARPIFQAMRSPAGEEIVLQKNIFVERILPASVLRGLTAEEMAVYRRPYLEAGESRRPTLTWPREIPVEGEPADVVKIVESYARWLASSIVPKLFINADPGSILVGPQREFCRTWPKQQEVTVPGLHFIQEDSPAEIGQAIADFVTHIPRQS